MKKFSNKDILIIMLLLLFIGIIIIYVLSRNGSENVFITLEKNLLDFAEIAKSVSTLITELKEAEKKIDRKRYYSNIFEMVLKFEMSLRTTKNRLVILMSGLDKVQVLRNTVDRLVENIHSDQNKLINLKKDIQHFIDSIENCVAQKEDLRSSCPQIEVGMTDIKYQVKKNPTNGEDINTLPKHLSQEKLKHNDMTVSMLKRSRSDLEESLTTLKSEIEEYEQIVQKYGKDFRRLQTGNTKLFNEGSEMEKTDIEIMPKSTIILICIVVAYVPLSILICIVYYDRQAVAELKKKTEYLVQNIGKPTLRWESFLLLDKIIRRDVDELEKKYCIVSFHSDTHHRHIRMVGVCVEGRHREKNYEESDFIVTSHTSILNIPYVMVTLVFIDYNKQGQILETPGHDSNDIKLLTVQACRKKSNDVFVIYVGDDESRSLMPGLLFNPHLTTVTEHFELKQLEQMDRVLTVHERFTITQREKIAEAIA